MHKEGVEPLIMGMKQIAERRADFLGLNRSALSASSAVNSSRTFPSFLCLLVLFRGYETNAFSPSHIRPIRVIRGQFSPLFLLFFVSSRAFSWP